MNTANKVPKDKTTLTPIYAAANDPPAEVGPEDTIAFNRACSPVPASSIPVVSTGYRPTDFNDRRRVLRLVAGDLQAEAVLALEELTDNGATLRQDLGEFAPAPAPAKALRERVEAIGKSIAAQEALLRFHHEIEDIALSDTVVLLESAYREYQHRVTHVPQLAQRYAALERFFRARGAAISEGLARARTTKPESRA